MKVLLIILVCIASLNAASLAEKKQNRSDHRIVNGAEISIYEAPYHVSIQTKTGNHICGGTIIGDDEVLTTAECASKVSYNTHHIRYNTDEHNWGGIVANIWTPSSVYIHPNYKPGQLYYNIAVIRTGPFFPSSIYNQTALRCSEDEVNFERLTVAGWGYIRDQTGQLSTRLRQTELPYAGNTCKRYYQSIGQYIDETMFCAGDLDHGGTGICVGDLGGAAVKRVGSLNVITGVASHFNECGGPKLISLFTRVSSLHDWIRNSTYTNFKCYY